MRHVLAVLAVTSGVASAEPGWSEYNATQPARPAEQLAETACDMSVELRGAVAEVHEQHRVANPGPALLAATTDLALPAGAQLVGFTFQRGKSKAASAVPASVPITVQRVSSERILGADPAFVTAMPPEADGRARFRVVLQPLDPEQEIAIGVRWIALATIRDSSVQLVLPARGKGDGAACRGLIHASTGPGASVERIRVGHAEVGARGTATFVHGAADTTLSVVLAFAKQEPVVWTQTVSLGEGWSARAVTIATPKPKAPSTPSRVLLVIDGSRSMELVGRHNVKKLVLAIGATLQPTTRLEAIVYDRKAARLLGTWDSATPERVAMLVDKLSQRGAGNGSDPLAAFALAKTVLGEGTGTAQVILISDATLGDVSSDALASALGGTNTDLDVHSIALSPGQMSVPDLAALRGLVERYGGSHVELAAAELDNSLPEVENWLRPAWGGLALVADGGVGIGDQLLAGDGTVVTGLVRARGGKVKLTGATGAVTKPWSVAARAAEAAPIGQLALASDEPAGEPEVAEKLRNRSPAVDRQRAFVVLSTQGTAAANRRAMIVAGGPVTRLVDVDDPPGTLRAMNVVRTSPALGGSAVDRNTVKLLLRTQLQPAAFACYRRALGLDETLSGTVQFHFEIGRGELTRAKIIGLGNAAFDACVLDAAYLMTPPLPNPDYNTDDRTLVNYPLTFTVREREAFVIAGDADSSSPLDIDKIEGGVPGRKPVKAGNTSTPLGDLKVAPTK
jgi:hypothetical protein